jgi:hypothetical protein
MVPLPEPLPDASGILVRPTKTATGCEFEAASETGRVNTEYREELYDENLIRTLDPSIPM